MEKKRDGDQGSLQCVSNSVGATSSVRLMRQVWVEIGATGSQA